MLNTTLRNGLMLLVWLCLIFSVRAEEVPFPRPAAAPPTGGQSTLAGGSLLVLGLP